MPNPKKPLTLFLIITAVILILLTIFFRWQGDSGHDWRSIIDGDGKGYYAYLDQIFIKHNFGNAAIDYEHTFPKNNHSFLKYHCGTALLMSPFFLVALTVSSVVNLPIDAYAELFQKTVSIAAVFYLLMGLWFAARLLQQLKIRMPFILLALVLFLFGTNLLTYTVIHPAMSHVYSFFAISMLLWGFNSFLITQRWKYLLLSAVMLGLIYLIRPFNTLIALFLLFFINDFTTFKAELFSKWKRWILAAGVLLLVVLLQNFLWYIQCKDFLIWGYSSEGFYLLQPEMGKVLFSFRKGLFVYTPLLMISLFGILTFLKKHKFRFLITVCFMVFITWLISSWWCWTYSDGFGMRPFIEFYPVFIILFAMLLQNTRVWLRIIILIVSFAALSLNLFQSYQYQKGIIHSDYMNYDRYKYCFLKTSDEYKDCFGGSDDLVPYNKYKQQLIIESPLLPKELVKDSSNVIIPVRETQKAYIYNENYEMNFEYVVRNSDELFNCEKSYAEITLQKLDVKHSQFLKNLFVVSITYKNSPLIYFKSYPVEYYNNSATDHWHELAYTIILPRIQHKEFELKFYIWNKGLDIFLIKDIKIKIFRTA